MLFAQELSRLHRHCAVDGWMTEHLRKLALEKLLLAKHTINSAGIASVLSKFRIFIVE